MMNMKTKDKDNNFTCVECNNSDNDSSFAF